MYPNSVFKNPSSSVPSTLSPAFKDEIILLSSRFLLLLTFNTSAFTYLTRFILLFSSLVSASLANSLASLESSSLAAAASSTSKGFSSTTSLSKSLETSSFSATLVSSVFSEAFISFTSAVVSWDSFLNSSLRLSSVSTTSLSEFAAVFLLASTSTTAFLAAVSIKSSTFSFLLAEIFLFSAIFVFLTSLVYSLLTTS